MSERELLTQGPSLSGHGPLGAVVAVGGCVAAFHWADGVATLLGCAGAVVAGVAIAARAHPHELWLDNADLCERTGAGTRRLPLTHVDGLRFLPGLNTCPSVAIASGGISVVIEIDATTEPLRRGIGQRMRQAQSGRMNGDVRAMRSLFL